MRTTFPCIERSIDCPSIRSTVGCVPLRLYFQCSCVPRIMKNAFGSLQHCFAPGNNLKPLLGNFIEVTREGVLQCCLELRYPTEG